MPELPEVETVVRDLRRRIIGRTITAVWTDWPKAIKDHEDQSRLYVSQKAVNHFKKHIVGKKVERVERRAKNILIYLSDEYLMLVHQKMTGHFLIGRWRIIGGKAVGISPREIIDDSFNHHVHLIFTLSSSGLTRGSTMESKTLDYPIRSDNGRRESAEGSAIQLGLSDVRKFAKVVFGTRQQIESLPELAKLGPDALDIQLTAHRLKDVVGQESRPIKQVLMDPFVIAGIGNIYSDDILWRAKVHPKTRANQLSVGQIRAIHKAMSEVLTLAVKLRGTSTSDFRDTSGKEGGYTGHRLVYQRTGEPCGRCKSPIERTVIGGRSAHFCPKCQKI